MNQHRLDLADRVTLLLCLVPCLGVYLIDAIQQVAPYGFSVGGITPDVLASFLEMHLEGRARLRVRFGAKGALVVAGRVTVDVGRSAHPAAWMTAGLDLTTKAYSIITGIPIGEVADDPGTKVEV